MMNVIWWHDRLWSCHCHRGIVRKDYINIYSSHTLFTSFICIDYLWTSLFKLSFAALQYIRQGFIYISSGSFAYWSYARFGHHTLKSHAFWYIEMIESLLRRRWPFGHLCRYFLGFSPFDHLLQKWSKDAHNPSIFRLVN